MSKNNENQKDQNEMNQYQNPDHFVSDLYSNAIAEAGKKVSNGKTNSITRRFIKLASGIVVIKK